jgi:hypothetical protein
MDDEKTRTYPVREDMRFQYAFWTIERVAWVLLALVPLAALAGIFSNGPLSEKTAQAANSSFSLEYDRFQRKTVLSRFIVRVPAGASNEIRLRLSPAFQETYAIESMEPRPARSSAGEAGLDLFFQPADKGDLAAVIWATPRQFGAVKLRAETNGGALDFPVLIYP